MADFKKLTQTLEALGYSVRSFATAQEAADYLDSAIDGVSVGIGGSITVQEMDLYPRLAAHNQVIWHWQGASHTEAVSTDVYISSVNGLAETGEIINIDGTGNRVASTIYGHKKVYLVVGVNKIAPDYDAALWRARNIAAPKNAQRKQMKTPCAARGDKCYNCASPERICRGLTILWGPIMGMKTEIILLDEEMGF